MCRQLYTLWPFIVYYKAVWRIIKPEQHLGGALYWFLRGGNAANKGVLAVDIPLDLVNKLDALLQGQLITKELADV